MEDLLVDIHLAQSMAQESGGDTLDYGYKQSLYFAAALEKHGVTKADFDSSLTYYYIRADRFNDIYKNVAKRLSEQARDLGATEGEVNNFVAMKNSSDTIDIWRGDPTTAMTSCRRPTRRTARVTPSSLSSIPTSSIRVVHAMYRLASP